MGDPVVLTGARIWWGGYDLSGISNQVRVPYSVELFDATNFDTVGFRARVPGLKTYMVEGSGFFDAASDAGLFAAADEKTKRIVGVAQSDTIGDAAYFFHAFGGQVDRLGGVGEVAPYSFSAEPSGGQSTYNVDVTPTTATLDDVHLLRGRVVVPTTTITGASGPTTTTGHIWGVGANQFSSGKRLMASLHVFQTGDGGDTFDAMLQTSTDLGAWTDRIAFDQVAGASTPASYAVRQNANWTIHNSVSLEYTITGTGTWKFGLLCSLVE